MGALNTMWCSVKPGMPSANVHQQPSASQRHQSGSHHQNTAYILPQDHGRSSLRHSSSDSGGSGRQSQRHSGLSHRPHNAGTSTGSTLEKAAERGETPESHCSCCKGRIRTAHPKEWLIIIPMDLLLFAFKSIYWMAVQPDWCYHGLKGTIFTCYMHINETIEKCWLFKCKTK